MKTQRTLCFYRFFIVSCMLLFGSFFAFGQNSEELNLGGEKIKIYFETKTLTLGEAKTSADAGRSIILGLFVELPSAWKNHISGGKNLLTRLVFQPSQFDYKKTSGSWKVMANTTGGGGEGGVFASRQIASNLLAYNAPTSLKSFDAYSFDFEGGGFAFGSQIGELAGMINPLGSTRIHVADVEFKLDPADPMGFKVQVGAIPIGNPQTTRGFAILNLKAADANMIYLNSANKQQDWGKDPNALEFPLGGITVLAGLGTLS